MYADTIKNKIPLSSLNPQDTNLHRQWVAICIVRKLIASVEDSNEDVKEDED